MIQFSPELSGREGSDAFLRNLLAADWQNPQGPLRLNPNLAFADFKSASFFQNTRVLLTALTDSDATLATATGNLNRVFVRQLFDRIAMPLPARESTLAVCKTINELDVWPLHLARIVSQCAGLIARRNKRFQLTRLGQSLLPEAQAGALFLRLFLAYFRKFDLHYDFHLRDVPGIQQTMAVILWRLDATAGDCVPVRGLAPQLLLPGVLAQLHRAMAYPHDTEEWILAGYVFEPLHDFGLIERQEPTEWPSITEHDFIRVTPLWQKFISFAALP
jgi:hypothetical protein